jgi:hypothetical protein
MNRLGTLVAATLLTLLTAGLTGCASGGNDHTVDTKAWRAELADQGITVRDWPKYQAVFKNECGKSTDDLALFLTLSGAPSKDEMRTAFSYQCPEEIDKLNDAYASIENATNSVDQACSTPAEERNKEQAQLAEAMGC